MTIRVALVGLSSTAKTSWAAIAHLPYLQYAEKKGHYKIVALLNSSKEAAENSKKEFQLNEDVRTFGSPDELARDESVDMVIVLTRVDVHWPTVKPSIEAGKWIFVEWPLAKDLEEAKEFIELVNASSLPLARTFVGLKNRVDPVSLMLNKLVIKEQRLGKVHSVNFRGVYRYFGPVMSSSADYFNDLDVGGNMVTIYLIHQLDAILHGLGEASIHNLSARLLTGHKYATLVEGNFYDQDLSKLKVLDPKYPRNTHDQAMIHGSLRSNSEIVDGALVAVHTRGGKEFKDDVSGGASLRIYGEKGEIHIASDSGLFAHGLRGEQISFKLYDSEKDSVQMYPVEDDSNSDKSSDLSALPLQAQLMGQLYERFRLGLGGYPTVMDALENHKLIEAIYQSDRKSKEA